MTDFVLDQHNNNPHKFGDYTDMSMCILKYAKFLKQPLKLEMFVPCDEEGNVLEKPISSKYFDPTEPVPEEVEQEFYNYDKAKEKVLFEGFEFEKDNGTWFHIVKSYNNLNWRKDGNYFEFFKGYDIEKLSRNIDLTITPSAIKQIWL